MRACDERGTKAVWRGAAGSDMKIGVTLPSRLGSLGDVQRLAQRADAAGFDAQWSYEIFRNPLMVAAAAATVTRDSRIGTGITAALSRSPFDLANTAADLDDLSQGRMMLGIGTGAKEALRAYHNTDGKNPIPRMREYIDLLRLSWEYLATGRSAAFDGAYFRFRPPPLNPWGPRDLVRPEVPIYLAAMRPHMMRLCGSRANGWIGYFFSPESIDSVVREHLSEGALRAGRDVSKIEISVEMVCSISHDRELAFARARRQVGFYAVHSITDSLMAEYGLSDDIDDLRRRLRTEGTNAFAHTSDRLVDRLSITGTPEEARQKLQQYRDSVDLMMLHTPYVPPLTADDANHAFDNIVRTFAPQAATAPSSSC